jgi:hypothetical protein
MMSSPILPNQLYRHYKDQLYKIITLARSTDFPRHVYVIYQAQYYDFIFGDKCIWSRKIEEFQGEVTVDGKRYKRFELVTTQTPLST